VVAPLVVAGSPIGVLEVACRTRRLGGRADRLLRIVADRAAVAIEHARLENEARELADVVRRIGEGVVVADGDDRIVFANRAFHEMIGASDSLVGVRWTDFLAGAQDVGALTAQMRAPSFQGEERLNADEAIAGDELKHALTVIHQGASDSVETVRRLQEYSRPARVKGPEAVQLRDVLEQLLALTRPQWDNEAARRGIRYEIDLKADPAPAVLAVASEVREALLNILENALTAMPQGGRLTLHVRGEDERAIVSISDTGKGMNPEVQRLAFEPCFTTRSTEGGTGLGRG